MNVVHRRAVHALAAWLLCIASLAQPAAGKIGLTNSTGEILAGQSSNDSSSTTIVSQGQVFLDDFPTTATTRVGFNINADAGPGLVAIETGLASFDVRFTVDHAASFDLIFEFLLRGQLLRVEDQACQGSISLADVEIPTVERLRDGAEFPLDVVLAGAALDFDGTTTRINLSGQDSRTLQFRDEPVETTSYRLTFQVSATALSQSCEVSARFGADNGSTTQCSACEYPGFEERIRDEDGLFVTLTVASLCGNGTPDPGEQCDQGELNGTDGSCCDNFCRAKSEGSACPADRSLCTADVCNAGGRCVHPLRNGTTCDNDGFCTCDDDGLFCNGLVRCPLEGGLCVMLPAPCSEDDTCDEERDLCVSPFATATSTPDGTLTATPTATPTNLTPGAATPTATANICAGDCDGNRMVVVNELILGVNIALDNQPASVCAAFDSNRDDRVAVNELVAGVNNALAGCRP